MVFSLIDRKDLHDILYLLITLFFLSAFPCVQWIIMSWASVLFESLFSMEISYLIIDELFSLLL